MTPERRLVGLKRIVSALEETLKRPGLHDTTIRCLTRSVREKRDTIEENERMMTVRRKKGKEHAGQN